MVARRSDTRRPPAPGSMRSGRSTRRSRAPTTSSAPTASFAETDLRVGRVFESFRRTRVRRRRRRTETQLGQRRFACPSPARSAPRRTCSTRGMRALPEQLGAAIAAADADVRVEVEDGVARQLDVAGDERRRQIELRRASARWPGGAPSACGLCTSASNSSSSASRGRLVRRQVARQRQPRAPVLRGGGDQPAAQRREAVRRRRSWDRRLRAARTRGTRARATSRSSAPTSRSRRRVSPW